MISANDIAIFNMALQLFHTIITLELYGWGASAVRLSSQYIGETLQKVATALSRGGSRFQLADRLGVGRLVDAGIQFAVLIVSDSYSLRRQSRAEGH